jgi:hypothetical protein
MVFFGTTATRLVLVDGDFAFDFVTGTTVFDLRDDFSFVNDVTFFIVEDLGFAIMMCDLGKTKVRKIKNQLGL